MIEDYNSLTWVFILYVMLARQQGGQDVQAVGDELESDWSVDLLPMGADGPSGSVQPSTSSSFVSKAAECWSRHRRTGTSCDTHISYGHRQG